MSTSQPDHSNARQVVPEFLQEVADALRGLKYGTVTLIVQDGILIQVDRTERRRLTRVPRAPRPEG